MDPENLYEVDSEVPDLTGAVLLHHFEGFMDAGAAGRLLAEHLLETLESRVIARFDIDGLIDYRSRRPLMTYATDHWEDYAAPQLVVHLLWDSAGHPFLLLTGLEPDRSWEAFVRAVQSLIDRWGVRLTVGFHGIPMGVPHTRPLNVIGHATRPELVSEYQPFFNRVQVPGNVSGLLEFRLGQAGHDAMGFAAQVPHYLAQSQYPTAAVTLLDAVARATGLALPIGSLIDAAQAADAEIHRQVAESEEVAQVVEALERQYDAFIQTVGNTDLPSADELGAEFERFLAEQQRPPDHL